MFNKKNFVLKVIFRSVYKFIFQIRPSLRIFFFLFINYLSFLLFNLKNIFLINNKRVYSRTNFYKKGTSASGAALFLFFLMLALIFYVLLLRPADRALLLDGSYDSSINNGINNGGVNYGYQSNPTLILSETPGTIVKIDEPTIIHKMPSIVVGVTKENNIIAELNNGFLFNSLFNKHFEKIVFKAPSVADNYLLAFNIDYALGNLLVFINGNLIFNKPIMKKSPIPIKIPNNLIIPNKENVILLATDEPGFAFWKNHYYELKNIVLSAELTDFSNAEANSQFSLSEEEFSSLNKALLSFIPECDENSGRLTIILNNDMIFSGYPDCGIKNDIEISKEQLINGSNKLLFVSDKGTYLINNIRLITEREADSYPIYYFNLPLEMFDQIDLGDSELLLTIKFNNYEKTKRGEIVINGFVQSFTTNDLVYQATIDPGILMPGPNTVMIRPLTKLNIAELKIELI